MDRRHRIAILLRSVAMLSPGQRTIERDEAYELLVRLHDLEVLLDELRRLLDELDQSDAER